MPRDSNGTYSLPAGNPVVTGTVISSTWANASLEDIGDALTDSLSRSGDGGMTAPLELDSGTVGSPGLTWSSETTSGLYRAGAGDHRYSISGADKIQITTNGLRTIDGVVGTPSLSFISDTDTGIYRSGANEMQLAAGGSNKLGVNASNIVPTVPFLAPVGAVGTPSYSFTGNSNTGIYSRSSDEVTISCAGVNVAYIHSGFVQFDQAVFITDGTAGNPALRFNSDVDTGIYRPASNQLGFSCGAALQGLVRPGSWDFNPGGGAVTTQIQASGIYVTNGSATTPAYSFISDTDTGIYRPAADTLVIMTNGSGVNGAIQISPTACLIQSVILNFNNYTVSNSASAGGVHAVPATVAGYLPTNINGSLYKIPYFAS